MSSFKINKPKISLIQNNDGLRKFNRLIANSQIIALDTEFVRDKTYYPKFCLLQISDGINIGIVDLLNNLDRELLSEVIYDSSKIKIFHSATHDIEVLYNYFGRIPSNIFDTQLAASFCGYGDMLGYSQLVKIIFGEDVDKSLRYTDWSLRPLSAAHLSYAAQDVYFLPSVYFHLHKKLSDLQRLDWLIEEQQEIINEDYYNHAKDHYWRRFPKEKLARKHRRNAFLLCIWREEYAKSHNLPRQKILLDADIIKIALLNKPEKLLLKIIEDKGLDKKDEAALIDVFVSDDNQDICFDLAQNTSYNKDYLLVLKEHLTETAKYYNIPERLIATTENLKDFLRGKKSLKITNTAWRYKIFGDFAENLMNHTNSKF